jgi:hypothetical protein
MKQTLLKMNKIGIVCAMEAELLGILNTIGIHPQPIAEQNFKF